MKHTLRSNVNPATSFLARNKFLYWGNKQPNTYLSNYGWYHFLSIRRSVCIATRCRPGRTMPRQIQWNREKRRSLFLLGEVDATLYDGTLPHRSVQRSTIQFQPDSRPTSILKDPIVTASNNHQHPLLQGLNREEREIYAELLSVNNSKSESGYILHLLDVWKGTANLKKAVANIQR